MKKQKTKSTKQDKVYISKPNLVELEKVLTSFIIGKIDYKNLYDYKPNLHSREVELTAFIAVACQDLISTDFVHPDELKRQVNKRMQFPDNTTETFSSLYNDTAKKIKYSNIGYVFRFILYQSGKKLSAQAETYYANTLDLFDVDCTIEKDKNCKYNGIRLNKTVAQFLSKNKSLVATVKSKVLKTAIKSKKKIVAV